MRRVWGALFAIATILGSAGAAPAADRPIYGPPDAWVDVLPAPAAKATATDEQITLHVLDVQVRVEPESTATYTRQILRVNAASGLQAAGNLAFSWNPAIETLKIHSIVIRRGAETIDAVRAGDGITVLRREPNLEGAMLDGALTASIQPPGLRVGDVLDVAVTIRSADPILSGRPEVVNHVSTEPAERVRYRADWPETLPVRWRAAPGAPSLSEFASGDRAGVRFDARNVAPLHIPDGAPPRFYETGFVELSAYPSFEAVSDKLAALYADAARVSDRSALAAEIARIKAATSDPRARALAALRLVQDDVRYFYVSLGSGGYTPASAEETWLRRFGDCKGKTVLLVALLNGLGIAAEPALVSTTRYDGLDTRLPMLASFDHVIVRAVVGGEVFWLDGADVGDRTLNSESLVGLKWALPLRAGGSGLVPLPSSPLTTPQSATKIEVDATGGVLASAPAKAQVRLRGTMAEGFKTQLAAMAPGERDEFARTMWTAGWGWIKPKSAAFTFDEVANEMVLNVEGSVELRAWVNAPAVRFSIPPLRLGVASLDSLPELGDNPVAVPFPVFTTSEVRVRLPASRFTIDAEPVDQTIGAVHVVRRGMMRDGDAEFTLSTKTLASELSAAEAKAARSELGKLGALQVYVQSASYTRTEADLQAIEKLQSGPEARLQKAIDLLNTGKPKEARAIFDQIISDKPDSEWALANRGMTYLDTDEPERAEADFARALAINPGVYIAYHGRGRIALEQSRFQDAVTAFSTALRLRSDSLYALRNRAVAYFKLKDFSAAEQDFRGALKADPSAIGVRVGLVTSLVELDRRDEAKTALAPLTEGLAVLSSEWEDALMLRSNLAIQLGLLDLALDDANTLVATSAAQVPVLARRCHILALSNADLEQARSDCDRARKLDPTFEDAYAGLGIISFRQGSAKKAVEELSRALRKNPRLEDLRFVRGLAYQQLGDQANAAADFAAAKDAPLDVERSLARYGLKRQPAPGQ